MRLKLFKISSLTLFSLEIIIDIILTIFIFLNQGYKDILITFILIMIFVLNLIFFIGDIKSIHNNDYFFQPLVFNNNGSTNKKFITILIFQGSIGLILLGISIYFLVMSNLNLFLLLLTSSIFILFKIIIFIVYIYNSKNNFY